MRGARETPRAAFSFLEGEMEKQQNVTAIRLSSEQRRDIDRAAKVWDMTRSAFIRAAAIIMAQRQTDGESK